MSPRIFSQMCRAALGRERRARALLLGLAGVAAGGYFL